MGILLSYQLKKKKCLDEKSERRCYNPITTGYNDLCIYCFYFCRMKYFLLNNLSQLP